MIVVHTISIGQPQDLIDERGPWQSAIFRKPVQGPIALHQHGLEGDQVADTAHHGSADQAVCCHPLVHYDYWNALYQLETPDRQLGPGSVGENWTLGGMTEEDICIGDVFSVGSARVQVSAPRYPCIKQERKLKLPQFHQRTIQTLRTGFYLRVLIPGIVQAGDHWILEQRPHPTLTVHRLNGHCHQEFDPLLAQELLAVAELGSSWKRVLRIKLEKHGKV
ncbi:MAG: molybdenum cofactor biosynthesis protein [Herpetosiphonaceae bacterium]|nr:MAG: molybdenum cofactor biosynthesis protein [Herpetosiphonaceae bacterium]